MKREEIRRCGVKKARWEEIEKDCVGREWVGSERGIGTGGLRGGKDRKEMHKQMLALGIDAISSVSQLMTNSMEKREEQKESSNSVSKSKRVKTEQLCERDKN